MQSLRREGDLTKRHRLCFGVLRQAAQILTTLGQDTITLGFTRNARELSASA